MATIRVKAGIDSTQYRRGIDQMQQKNKRLESSFGDVGKKFRKAFALGALVAGDPVNLETDVLAKYVQRQLASQNG